MAPYPSNGSLTTDKRTVDDSITWDSQSDWEAYQSASNVEIVDGSVQLPFSPVPLAVESLWEFEDDSDTSTAVDSIDGNPLSLDSPVYDSTASVGDLAILFDGDDTAAAGTSFDWTSGGSVAFWVNTDDIGENHAIWDHGWGAFETNDHIRFRYLNGSGDVSAEFRDLDGNDNQVNLSASHTHGTWTHYAIVVSSNGDVELYQDNSVADSDTSTYSDVSNASDSGGEFQFGENYTFGSRGDENLDGQLDDAAMGLEAFSASDVNSLYQRGQ